MIITCLTDCLVWGYKNFSLKSRKAKITGERKQQQKRTFIITDYSYRESEGENGSWILRRKSENKRKDPRRWLQSRPDWEVGNLQWEKLFYFFPGLTHLCHLSSHFDTNKYLNNSFNAVPLSKHCEGNKAVLSRNWGRRSTIATVDISVMNIYIFLQYGLLQTFTLIDVQGRVPHFTCNLITFQFSSIKKSIHRISTSVVLAGKKIGAISSDLNLKHSQCQWQWA